MKENILGYFVDKDDVKTCVDEIFNSIRADNRFRWLACLNPHSYVVSLEDKAFEKALHSANWLVPDGIGIVLASKMLRGSISHRVTGSDVFWELNRRLNEEGGRSVFFLGSTQHTLELIHARMQQDFPKVRVAGIYSPPFYEFQNEDTNAEIIQMINSAKPDVLWVGMTAPKQEKWILQNSGQLKTKFAAAIGGVFDFYSGNVQRTSVRLQACGLEWLPRLLREPTRLWRRTIVSAPRFLVHVIRARFRG